jgi:hypothetical protein
MRFAAHWTGLLAIGWLWIGCTTTGDPRQGGLFGWSEAKARERQKERQQQLAGEEAELSREDARASALEARDANTEHGLISAMQTHHRAEERLRAQQRTVLAKIDELETESPTPALASRARTYRGKVNTIAAQSSLTLDQRAERLRAIESEIDSALDRLKHL